LPNPDYADANLLGSDNAISATFFPRLGDRHQSFVGSQISNRPPATFRQFRIELAFRMGEVSGSETVHPPPASRMKSFSLGDMDAQVWWCRSTSHGRHRALARCSFSRALHTPPPIRNGIALTCCCRVEWTWKRRSKRRHLNQINDGVVPPQKAGRNFFRTNCELDHIHPYESGVIWGHRVGASQFQYPGRAMPHGRHIPPAALFFVAGFPNELTSRRQVICVSPGLPV
jgi:hypothetical protein